jgi:hypothetical protein
MKPLLAGLIEMSFRTRRPTADMALALVLVTAFSLGGCSSIVSGDNLAADDASLGGGEADDGSDEQDEDGSDEPPSPELTDMGGEPEPLPEPLPATEGADPPLDPLCGDAEATLEFIPGDADSLGAATMVRSSVLGANKGIPNVALSPRPFLNYYGFDYPPADPGTLGIHADLWEVEKGPSDQLRLQLGVSTPALDDVSRPPLHVVMVVDATDESIGTRLVLAREAVAALASELKSGDHVTVLAVGEQVDTLLEHHPIAGPADATLDGTLAQLNATGEGSLDEALQLAYALSAEYQTEQISNRIVVLSGGSAEISASTLALASESAELSHGQGANLVGVGLGPLTDYEPASMEAIANAGRGPALFIGEEADAWTQLGEQFGRNMVTAIRDLEIEVVLPEGLGVAQASEEDAEFPFSPASIQLGYEDALVFHEPFELCGEFPYAGEILVTLRWYEGATGLARQSELALPISATPDVDQPPRVHKAAAVVAYVDALSCLQAQVEDAPSALYHAQAMVEAASEHLPEDTELAEMSEVLSRLSTR